MGLVLTLSPRCSRFPSSAKSQLSSWACRMKGDVLSAGTYVGAPGDDGFGPQRSVCRSVFATSLRQFVDFCEAHTSGVCIHSRLLHSKTYSAAQVCRSSALWASANFSGSHQRYRYNKRRIHKGDHCFFDQQERVGARLPCRCCGCWAAPLGITLVPRLR